MNLDQSGSLPDLNPLIGRTADLARLREEMGARRLVTITGPGGVGKTRLAQETIRQKQRPAADIWFVDLAATQESGLVLSLVAQVLDIDYEASKQGMSAIGRRLAGRDTVIVLDNLEQIRDIGPVVAELLEAIPRLRVLATSRTPLGVVGEAVLPLRPLELSTANDAQGVAASAAGALFLARARSVGRIHRLNDETAQDVAELLRRLDGLPLAIELAAARTRALTPREILHRVDVRGPSAVDGEAGPTRHSLLEIIEWTLGLLDGDAREVLDAASLCAGFDLELIEAMVAQPDVLPGLESLILLGLVSVDTRGTKSSRYGLLEVIRNETSRRLDPALRTRLAGRFTTEMARRAAVWFAAPARDWREFTRRGDTDAGNYLKALDYLEQTAPTSAISLWHHLELFWTGRGRQAEGASRFERLRRMAGDTTVDLARATAIYLRLLDGLHGPAKIVGEANRAVQMARSVGDARATITALEMQILAHDAVGDAGAVRASLSELEAIDTDSIDPSLRGMLRHTIALGTAVIGWTSDAAVAAFVAARDATDSDTDDRNAATSTNLNLAEIHLMRNEFALAEDSARRAIAKAEEADDDRRSGYAFMLLASSLAGLDRLEEAVVALRDAWDRAGSYAQPEWLSEYMLKALPVAILARQPLLAAQLWGVSCALVQSGLASTTPDQLQAAERAVQRLGEAAAPSEIERAIRSGMTSDAVAVAERLPDLLLAALPTGRLQVEAGRLRHGELTKRELEVLRLVGMGHTDAMIAEVLFISPKTASVHVSNIKAKLGLNARVEVALKARELGRLDLSVPA